MYMHGVILVYDNIRYFFIFSRVLITFLKTLFTLNFTPKVAYMYILIYVFNFGATRQILGIEPVCIESNCN